MNLKFSIFFANNWRSVLIVIISFLLLLFMIPIALLSCLFPSANESIINDYKHVGQVTGIDWCPLIAYDTVRYDNNFNNVSPKLSAFDFFIMSYVKYEKKSIPNGAKVLEEGNVSSSSKDEYILVKVKSFSTSSYLNIHNMFLRDFNFDITGLSWIKILDKINNINSSELYDFTICRLDIYDLINDFDEQQIEWLNTLLTNMHILYNDVPEYDNFYLPDGVYPFIHPSPTSTVVTSPFGMRYHPIKNKYKYHYGVDFSKSGGSFAQPVVSIADGVVLEVNYSNGDAGWNVRISHTVLGNSWKSRYCHLSNILVNEGDVVSQGQIIGAIGDTGSVTASHLHFELKYQDGLVDPLLYLLNNSNLNTFIN